MVGLIDYGMGNLQSVINAGAFLGVEIRQISHAAEIATASRIILPGVGSFKQGMSNLHQQKMVDPIRQKVEAGTPLLGICLGMQLLVETGSEGGDTTGLALLDGHVRKMDDSRVRLPHVGWNNISVVGQSELLNGTLAESIDGADFYFVHSYFVSTTTREQVLAEADYPDAFPAIIGERNVLGVQFHPEKSHKAGLQILSAFLSSKC
jgi:glutamine amidotransferase